MPERSFVVTLTDEYVSISEAADRIGIHRVTLHRWINEGTVPVYRLGPNRRRIRVADLDALAVPEGRAA